MAGAHDTQRSVTIHANVVRPIAGLPSRGALWSTALVKSLKSETISSALTAVLRGTPLPQDPSVGIFARALSTAVRVSAHPENENITFKKSVSAQRSNLHTAISGCSLAKLAAWFANTARVALVIPATLCNCSTIVAHMGTAGGPMAWKLARAAEVCSSEELF